MLSVITFAVIAYTSTSSHHNYEIKNKTDDKDNSYHLQLQCTQKVPLTCGNIRAQQRNRFSKKREADPHDCHSLSEIRI